MFAAIRQLQELDISYVEAYGQGDFDGQNSGHDFFGVSFPLRLCCSRWDGRDVRRGARTTEGARGGADGERARCNAATAGRAQHPAQYPPPCCAGGVLTDGRAAAGACAPCLQQHAAPKCWQRRSCQGRSGDSCHRDTALRCQPAHRGARRGVSKHPFIPFSCHRTHADAFPVSRRPTGRPLRTGTASTRMAC